MKYYIALYCNVIINFVLFYFFVLCIWAISNNIYPKSYWVLLLVIFSAIHFVCNLPNEWTFNSIRRDFLKYKNSRILEFLISIKIIYVWALIIMLPGMLMILFEIRYAVNKLIGIDNNDDKVLATWYSKSFKLFTYIAMLVVIPSPKHPYINNKYKYCIEISIHSKTNIIMYNVYNTEFLVTINFTYIRKGVNVIGYKTSIDNLSDTIAKIINDEVLRLGYVSNEITLFIHPYINSKYNNKTENYITRVYIITNSSPTN